MYLVLLIPAGSPLAYMCVFNWLIRSPFLLLWKLVVFSQLPYCAYFNHKNFMLKVGTARGDMWRFTDKQVLPCKLKKMAVIE